MCPHTAHADPGNMKFFAGRSVVRPTKNITRHNGKRGGGSEELTAIEERKVVTTSAHDVLEEYLSNHQHLNSQVEGRLVYKGSA